MKLLKIILLFYSLPMQLPTGTFGFAMALTRIATILTTVTQVTAIPEATPNFYMNWGWEGGSNAWFASGNFNPGNSNYNNYVHMIKGIRR